MTLAQAQNTPSRSLSTDIAIAIFVASAVIALSIFLVVQNELKQTTIKNQLNNIAYETQSIAQIFTSQLEGDIHRVMTVVKAPLITQTLLDSNQTYDQWSAVQRTQNIQALNQQWMSASSLDPLIIERTTNPLAAYLRRLVMEFPDYYGEIFITNKYGAMIASSAKLTTLAHQHKYWWQGAYNEGTGAVFVDDRGFDESVGDYVVGIVTPVWYGQQIIGIIKANIKVTGPLNNIVNEHNQSTNSEVFLARERGKIIARKNTVPLESSVSQALLSQYNPALSNQVQTIQLDGGLYAVAAVDITNGIKDHQVFMGGKPITKDKDARLGNEGESWLVFTTISEEAALSTFYQARQDTYTVMGILIVGSIIAAGIAARLIARRDSVYKMKLLQMNQDLHDSNDKLREATLKAQAANKAKSAFVSNMSHEIRTPMNGVLGLLDVVMKTDLTAQQKDYLSKIERSGKSLIAIINDILDYSKLESQKLELDIKPFSLQLTMRDCHALFEASASEKNLTLSLILDDNLAQAYAGDALRISQILNNLLGNAIKFTERGNIVVNVEKQLSTGDNTTDTTPTETLRFSVCDTGIGIPTEYQTQIFEAFSQAKHAGTHYIGGTGLGLQISKQLVTKMGGKIWLESTEQVGSTFYFTLPLAVADSATLPSSTEPQGDHKLEFNARALVVEDNEINQIVAREILLSYGFKVELVSDGLAALELVTETDFDIIFMDLQMPIMDGFTCTSALRDAGITTPVIALSAAVLQEDKQRASAAGVDDHLAKPILREQLEGLLTKHLPHTQHVA